MAAPQLSEAVGTGGSIPEGTHTLIDAKVQMKRVFREFGDRMARANVIELGPGVDPPPKFTSTSILYVCYWDSGFFYVGETDDIMGRLKFHRIDDKWGLTRGRTMEVAFVAVADKSVARQLEASLQKHLLAMGFPLLSESDAKHRNFGGGG